MKIIQITDTHLFAEDEAMYHGAVFSNKTYRAVIDRIRKEDLADANMIFLTGDLSQDESSASYQKVADALQSVSVPIYWIPGNHDDIAVMESVFNKVPHFFRVTRFSTRYWEFIFLNTKIEQDTTGIGCVSEAELIALKEQLKKIKTTNKSIAIVMHHHPKPVNTPLVDKYILQNHQEFLQEIAGSKVKLIMTGHVHNDYCVTHQGMTIETAPATCLQWKKGTVDLVAEYKIGYKVYHFNKNQYRAEAKVW
jgi:Icc protein